VHPQGSKYLSDAYRARSKFFRPKTRAAVRKNEAIAAEAFFQTEDVVSVTAPDDDDPAQQASAEILKELLNYRLTKSVPWFLTLIGGYQDAQVQGLVCSYQYWEFNAAKKIDRPCVKLRPIENIRFDPSADWTDPVNTSPYFIDMIPMYVKDVQARSKMIDPKTGQPRWAPMSDGAAAGRLEPVFRDCPAPARAGPRGSEQRAHRDHRLHDRLGAPQHHRGRRPRLRLLHARQRPRHADRAGAHRAGLSHRQAAVLHRLLGHRDAQELPAGPGAPDQATFRAS
jgi:hypothetical protein